MKTKIFNKKLLVTLSIVLIAVMALFIAGCTNNSNTEETTTEPPVSTTENVAPTSVGEGQTTFTFTVTDLEGKETVFEVKTDKKTVGEALLDEGLIAGDNGEFGLYVKTVNGVTVDYDKDGKYWAFYVDGTMASVGVDSTEIKKGSTYSFKAE
ncbi:MAG: DUF4430 domain-containing protein [Clostridia bacterium]|nr:DUF4430 domain-containing protein [Clostridia bacterium]